MWRLIEIHFQRYEREALALRGANELGNLPLVQEKPPGPARLVVEAVGLQVLRDIGVKQEHLVAGRSGIGFGDRRLSGAQ